MGIIDKFKGIATLSSFRQDSQPKIDKEIVSSIGVTDFWSLDGTTYNPDNIKIDTYDKIYRNHQAKSCLNIIRYSLQQVDWFIQSEDEEAKDVLTFAINRIWNNLMKSVSKSFRYGYSPNVKVFELTEIGGKEYVIYKRIKDLNPKDCTVKVDKWGNYDGFIYKNEDPMSKVTVEPKYSFWYSSDMENGNNYGNSMLKDVYKPWFYSEKIHTYANRYYERFGEPLVVGRAPSGNSKVKDANGKVSSAQNIMAEVIDSIRSHSSAQLPSDKHPESKEFLYDIKYLESQMRGFDFDNYLSRLDMEITRGLIVPDLMFSSGSGGSYGLGSAQIEAFYTNLMGIMDNIVDYVDRYIIPQLIDYNFNKKITATIAYQPLSVESKTFINEMINNLIKLGKIEPSIEQIEERSGFKFEKIEQPDPVVSETKITKKIKENAEIIVKEMMLDKKIKENEIIKVLQ